MRTASSAGWSANAVRKNMPRGGQGEPSLTDAAPRGRLRHAVRGVSRYAVARPGAHAIVAAGWSGGVIKGPPFFGSLAGLFSSGTHGQQQEVLLIAQRCQERAGNAGPRSSMRGLQ